MKSFLSLRELEMVQQKCWGCFSLYWLTSWHFRLKLVENDGFAELLDCFISFRDALWLSRLFWAPSVTFIPKESPFISFMPTTDGQAVPFSLKVFFFCSSSLSREQCCFLCTLWIPKLFWQNPFGNIIAKGELINEGLRHSLQLCHFLEHTVACNVQ